MADKQVSFTVAIKDLGSAVFNQLGGAAESFGSKLFSLKSIVSGFSGALAAVSISALVKDMVDLGVAADTTFRQIAANLPTFTEGLGDLRDQIEQIANISGRSTESLQSAAMEIAKLGVGSATELQQELAAATTLADATGTSVDEAAQLLIQLRREFGVTGDQALEMAAKLASVSQGKVAITELLAAFTSAAPIFQKFGIDATTATQAIAALVSHGITTTRQIRQILNEAPDAGFIDAIAKQAPIAADAMQQLKTRAQETEDGMANAGQRIKNDFNDSLARLGTEILPPLQIGLSKIFDVLSSIVMLGRGDLGILGKLLSAGSAVAGASGPIAAAAALAGVLAPDQPAAAPPALPPGFKSAIPDSALTGGPSTLTLGPTKADLAQAEKARAEMAALGLEFDRLAASDDKATAKSDAFAQSIDAYIEKATKAHLPTDALNSDLEVLYAKLDKLKQQDAENLFKQITSSLADLTGNTVDTLSTAVDDQAALWRTEVNNTSTYTQAQKDALNAVINQWGILKKATNDAAIAIRQAQTTQATVQGLGPNATVDQLAAGQTALQSSLLGAGGLYDQRSKLLADGATTSSKEYLDVQREIDSVQKDIAGLGDRILFNNQNVVKPAKDTLQTLQQQASAIREAIDGVLQLGEAFGLVSQNTAKILADVGEIATQVPVFAKALSDYQDHAVDANGNPLSSLTTVLGAALPIAGGIASLVSSLTSESPAEKAHVQALENNSVALQNLTTKLGSLTGNSLTSATQLISDLLSGKTGAVVDKSFGHGGVDFVATTAANFQQLQAFAQSLGLTFDGSVESLKQLQQAAAAAGDAIGKLGTDYQSEQTYYSGLSSIEGLTGVDAFNVNALSGASQSPLLAQLLSGFDLSSDAGRQAAIQQLIQQYQRGAPSSANPFTSGELGGLTTDQLEQAIQQWAQAIQQMPPVVQSVADQLKSDLSDLSQKASVLDETPIQELGDKVTTYAKDFGGALGDLADGFDLTKQSDIEAYKTKLQDFYQGISDGSIQVDTSVFSLEDWKSAIADLIGSVDSAAASFASASQTISAADAQIDTGADIMGTSPEDTVQQHATNEGFDLSHFDLTTKAGVDGAIAYLQGIYQLYQREGPSNVVDYDDQVKYIQGLIDSLRKLPEESATGDTSSGSTTDIPPISDSYSSSTTASVTSISSAEAGGIIGEIQTSNTYLAGILDALTQWINPGVGSLPSFARNGVGAPVGAAGAGGSGSPLEVIAIVELDGKQIALAMATALLDPQVSQEFGRSMTRVSNRTSSGLGLPRQG